MSAVVDHIYVKQFLVPWCGDGVFLLVINYFCSIQKCDNSRRFNPLFVDFVLRNINMYFHFLPILDNERAKVVKIIFHALWRNQMEIFSALLVICEGNSSVRGEFPAQRPVTRSVFDLRLE